jgi:hypothetical protein
MQDIYYCYISYIFIISVPQKAFYFQLQYTQDFCINHQFNYYFVCKMARAKSWARKSTGGKTPRKQLVRAIFVRVYVKFVC